MKFKYVDENGKVNIVHPFPKEKIEQVLGPLTDEQYIAHIKEVSFPPHLEGISEFIQIDDNEIPENRSNRDSWVDIDGNIKEGS